MGREVTGQIQGERLRKQESNTENDVERNSSSEIHEGMWPTIDLVNLEKKNLCIMLLPNVRLH